MTKPMLAVAADFTKIKYPVYASPKLDGIRCLIIDGVAKTRTLKDVPNKEISALLSLTSLNGLDGELIVGKPTSKTVYNETVSQVMAHDKGAANVTFYVFDTHDLPTATYRHRLDGLFDSIQYFRTVCDLNIELLDQVLVHDEEEMLTYEADCVVAGYEGIILRSPESPYKYGRSTVNEGYLVKVKRFSDFESEIIGFAEELFNGNVAQTNELGRTKRSTAASGLVGKGTLGALLVRDIETGIEFAIGTGFSAAERQDYWNRRTSLLGEIVKYKCFEVGRKIAPRHPVFLGFRSKLDL